MCRLDELRGITHNFIKSDSDRKVVLLLYIFPSQD